MDRPVQVGDFARVILDNETQTYPIEHIDGLDIYLSVEEGDSLRLIPVNGTYQVRGLGVNHRVEFLANDVSSLTGILDLDLIFLEELDDEDLETICQVDDYIKSLCEGDQLWINKIVKRYGQSFIAKKPDDISFQDYYYSLIYPHSVGGANLAVARNDHQGLELLESLGFSPNISQEWPSTVFLIQPPLGGNQGIPQQGALRTGEMEPLEFSSYLRMSEDLMNFFREVDVGPQVAGDFVPGLNHLVVDVDSLKPIEGTRLNDLFYFLQPQINGQVNPLYGITHYILFSSNHLTFFANTMMYDIERLSASDAMRRHLGNLMRARIDSDVLKTKDESGLAYEKGEQLKRAIDDPSLDVSGRLAINGRQRTIFNPNNFSTRDFAEILLAGMVEQVPVENIDAFEVSHVYSIIPGITPENALEKVLLIYKRIINIAKMYQESLIANE